MGRVQRGVDAESHAQGETHAAGRSAIKERRLARARAGHAGLTRRAGAIAAAAVAFVGEEAHTGAPAIDLPSDAGRAEIHRRRRRVQRHHHPVRENHHPVGRRRVQRHHHPVRENHHPVGRRRVQRHRHPVGTAVRGGRRANASQAERTRGARATATTAVLRAVGLIDADTAARNPPLGADGPIDDRAIAGGGVGGRRRLGTRHDEHREEPEAVEARHGGKSTRL
jgi:hypothetical protein